jgi:hypothetical protein
MKRERTRRRRQRRTLRQSKTQQFYTSSTLPKWKDRGKIDREDKEGDRARHSGPTPPTGYTPPTPPSGALPMWRDRGQQRQVDKKGTRSTLAE